MFHFRVVDFNTFSTFSRPRLHRDSRETRDNRWNVFARRFDQACMKPVTPVYDGDFDHWDLSLFAVGAAESEAGTVYQGLEGWV